MSRITVIFVCLALFAFLAAEASAQTQHFQFTSNTGNSATVAVLVTTNPNINGSPLVSGDEIGAFTPAGLCVGGIVWNSVNDAITVWRDNEQTGTIDGMQPGELIHYRVWRQSTDTEFASVVVTYLSGDGTYIVNATYTLTSLDATAPPDPPNLLLPLDSARGLSVTPTFSWDTTSFATTYSIEVATDTSFTSPAIAEDSITATSFNANGLANNTTYFWRVNASNSGGTSDWSTVRSFITIVGPPDLLSPTDGSVHQPISLSLTWNASSGATSYRVQVSTDTSFASIVVDNSNVTTTSSDVGPLANNTSYFWRVNATNADGTSDWSSVWSFTTMLAAPQLAAPPDSSIDQETTLTLSWNAVSGASSYRLQVSTSSSFSSLAVNDSGLTEISRQVGPLSNETAYFWRVSAENTDGISDWSTVWGFTTVPLPPVVTTLLSPADGSTLQPTTLTLSWDASSGAISYRLQVSTSSSFTSTIVDDSTVTSTSSEVGPLLNATTYHWRVNATNSGGTSDWSSVWRFTTIGTPMTHGIILQQGWNMISSFVQPQNTNLDTLTSGIADNLVIIKDDSGKVYWVTSDFRINDIGDWDYADGYQAYMSAGDTLMIPGNELIPEMNSLSLIQGWHMITYMRNSALDIDSALATIAGQIIIVKNGSGRVYWPEHSIDQIGTMMPGQGYQLKLTGASTLTYPANDSSSTGDMLTGRAPITLLSAANQEHKIATASYFSFKSNTGNNATVAIPVSSNPNISGRSLAAGDEIGAFSPAGLCVGAVVWTGLNTSVTVWGDDDQTAEIDGIRSGEKIHYRVWQQQNNQEFPKVIVGYSEGDSSYATNGLSVLSAFTAGSTTGIQEDPDIPTEFVLGQNYPNPFNPTTVITYGLPKSAMVRLEVFNIIGQRVAVLVEEEQGPGYHRVVFGTKLPAGIYIYRFKADEFTEIRKMILVR
ncbi:MAG: T9SS type A sorting domain-containing protein [Ignavibacteriales bacterium]|nr:T9SS type A sorting domain-containing protein [Ignavibacteriales bacterium]